MGNRKLQNKLDGEIVAMTEETTTIKSTSQSLCHTHVHTLMNRQIHVFALFDTHLSSTVVEVGIKLVNHTTIFIDGLETDLVGPSEDLVASVQRDSKVANAEGPIAAHFWGCLYRRLGSGCFAVAARHRLCGRHGAETTKDSVTEGERETGRLTATDALAVVRRKIGATVADV